MPDPTLDPRLTTLLTRVRSIRVELDRLDDALGLLDREARLGLESWAAVLRSVVEGLEDEIDRRAADVNAATCPVCGDMLPADQMGDHTARMHR